MLHLGLTLPDPNFLESVTKIQFFHFFPILDLFLSTEKSSFDEVCWSSSELMTHRQLFFIMRKGFFLEDPVLWRKVTWLVITQGYSWRQQKQVWWSHYLLVSNHSVHRCFLTTFVKFWNQRKCCLHIWVASSLVQW